MTTPAEPNESPEPKKPDPSCDLCGGVGRTRRKRTIKKAEVEIDGTVTPARIEYTDKPCERCTLGRRLAGLTP